MQKANDKSLVEPFLLDFAPEYDNYKFICTPEFQSTF